MPDSQKPPKERNKEKIKSSLLQVNSYNQLFSNIGTYNNLLITDNIKIFVGVITDLEDIKRAKLINFCRKL